MIEVLLIEDDDGDALLLKEAMSKIHFKNNLSHVQDGSAALTFLQDSFNPRPDFILLDLNMPKMNGHEVLKWIKSNDNFKDIPVGILTTSAAKEDITQAYKNYASYYITKPATFEELEAVVKNIEEFWVKTVKLPKQA